MGNYSQFWNQEFQKNTAFIDRKSLVNVLEIGSFEGLTSNYIVDNLLSDNGTLICVDPLADDYELDSDNGLFEGQYARFIENTDYNKDRIKLMREPSATALPVFRDNYFDLVFIDGHHAQPECYLDGTEAFRICKDFGWILFDDFLWGNTKPVKAAVEQVLKENTNYRLLLMLNQVLVQKLPVGSPTEDGQNEYQNKSTEILFGWDKIHAEYCNLDVRVDRNEKMKTELTRIGLQKEITRRRSFPWQELYDSYDEAQKEKVNVMFKRTPGAIGCHYSQVAIMEEALRQGKHALVMEDDLVFCDDFPARLKIIYKFLNQHEWDIFWFGGTYHKEGHWHVSVEGKHTHPDLQMCNCNLNRDWEQTLNPHIVRTYGAFSTHAYLVNKDRIQNILERLDRNVHRSMGIDWIMILEQPDMNTFAFDPGCVKQHDNQSNIGNGISVFSGFSRLGPHWFAPTMKNI